MPRLLFELRRAVHRQARRQDRRPHGVRDTDAEAGLPDRRAVDPRRQGGQFLARQHVPGRRCPVRLAHHYDEDLEPAPGGQSRSVPARLDRARLDPGRRQGLLSSTIPRARRRSGSATTTARRSSSWSRSTEQLPSSRAKRASASETRDPAQEAAAGDVRPGFRPLETGPSPTYIRANDKPGKVLPPGLSFSQETAS